MGIFGGGTDTATSTYTPVQKNEFSELLSGASNQFKQGFFDPSMFEESGVSGLTPQQLLALQQQQENLGSFSGTSDAASAGINQLLSGEINPIYEQQAQNQADFLQRNFERNVLPAIGDQLQGAGQFGSTRHGIGEGIAASDLNQQIAQSTGNIFAQGASEAQQGQQFALSNLSNLVNQSQAPSNSLFNIGSIFQNQNQAELSDLKTRQGALQQLPLSELQAYQQLISGNYGGTTTNTTPTAGVGGALAQLGTTALGSFLGGPAGGVIGSSLFGSGE